MGITDEFVTAWNATAAASGWIECRKLTRARENQLRLRMKDEFWAASWRDALAKAGPIPGLRGSNDRRWRANVDWFLRPGTVVKIVEGFYDAWKPKQTVMPGVPSSEESKRQQDEMREWKRKAEEEWRAKGGVPSLAKPGVLLPIDPVD